MARALVHSTSTPMACECCGQIDGVDNGVEVDTMSGLCLYCQPCPECGEMGTACYDDGAQIVCYGQ